MELRLRKGLWRNFPDIRIRRERAREVVEARDVQNAITDAIRDTRLERGYRWYFNVEVEPNRMEAVPETP